MPETRRGNEPLRRALAEARLHEQDVAEALGVDRKTVQRWLTGRVPQPRHRWGLADLVNRHEHDLWPRIPGSASVSPEIHATYPHRGSVPREVWRDVFDSAESEIDILVYSGLFLAEDVTLVRLLGRKAQAGVNVRILLGDPDSDHVTRRGDEEGIADAMAAKIRNAILLYRTLLADTGVTIRVHGTALYNSIYRADDDILINQHIYGVGAAFAPVIHLRHQEGGDLVATYLDSFERVWARARPLPD